MPATWGLGSSKVKAFVPPMGAPHASVGGILWGVVVRGLGLHGAPPVE